MTRYKLSRFHSERRVFRGIVSGFGKKNVFKGPKRMTVLLTSLVETSSGEEVADHQWLTLGLPFPIVHLGDTVEFEAEVKEYVKGYKGKVRHRFKPLEIDYSLTNLTNIRIKK